jgi:hypothetical protein
MAKTFLTEAQWQKLVDRLHKYKQVRMPSGSFLIIWENGDVSLRDGDDGHCIIWASTLDSIKRIFCR